MAISLSRRDLLARMGVLGAATAAAGLVPGLRIRAHAGPLGDLLDVLVDNGRPMMQQLAYETIAGLQVMIVPGSDEFSVIQGVTSDAPGAMDGHATEFLLDALDKFFPLPDTEATVLAQAFATGFSSVPIPEEFTNGLIEGSQMLDDAVLAVLGSDEEVPLSLVIAMSLNFVASLVDPAAIVPVNGFVSPFANLSHANKMEVFRMMEQDTVDVLAAIDTNLPEPGTRTFSGLIAFVPGALAEFVGFGNFGEFGYIDPDDPNQLTARPVAWDLTGFQPGALRAGHGWDELIGYFGDVQFVEGSWDHGQPVDGRNADA